MAWYTLLLICWGWLKAFNHSRSCNKETTLIKIALFCWLVPDSTTAPTANEEQGVHWQKGGSEQETAAAKLIQEAQGNQNSVILFLPSKPPTSVMQLHKCPLISTWTSSSSHKAETSAVSLCCPEALTKSQWQLGGLGESFLISSCGDPPRPSHLLHGFLSFHPRGRARNHQLSGRRANGIVPSLALSCWEIFAAEGVDDIVGRD